MVSQVSSSAATRATGKVLVLYRVPAGTVAGAASAPPFEDVEFPLVIGFCGEGVDCGGEVLGTGVGPGTSFGSSDKAVASNT